MKRPVSAVLWSAFVFPGAGELYLRRPGRAAVFLVPAAIAAWFFFSDMIERASALADQVLAGTLPLDPAAIAARLDSQGGSLLASVSGIVLIACWIGSIIDSFLVARAAPRDPK
jgi:TM2 domain-containing membrane protein YozV